MDTKFIRDRITQLRIQKGVKMREHRGVAADKLNIENALCKYLEKHHKGASKTISSKKLEVVFSVTGAEIRRAVNALRCACQPICSDTSGYYFGETQKEIMATVAQLNGRVQKIAMARDGLISSIERLEDS